MSFPICGVPGLWGIEKVRSKMDLEGERGIKTVAEEVNALKVFYVLSGNGIMKPIILYNYYILIKSFNLVKATRDCQTNDHALCENEMKCPGGITRGQFRICPTEFSLL